MKNFFFFFLTFESGIFLFFARVSYEKKSMPIYILHKTENSSYSQLEEILEMMDRICLIDERN